MSFRLVFGKRASIDTSAAVAVPRRPDREHRSTPRATTLTHLGLALSLAVSLAACGGRSHPKDTYAVATSSQEACCEHLQGPQRDACLGEIVRVDDPAVASSRPNQATYACVVEHFQCDPATGKATQASAQAQLDCIQDLN